MISWIERFRSLDSDEVGIVIYRTDAPPIRASLTGIQLLQHCKSPKDFFNALMLYNKSIPLFLAHEIKDFYNAESLNNRMSA